MPAPLASHGRPVPYLGCSLALHCSTRGPTFLRDVARETWQTGPAQAHRAAGQVSCIVDTCEHTSVNALGARGFPPFSGAVSAANAPPEGAGGDISLQNHLEAPVVTQTYPVV